VLPDEFGVRQKPFFFLDRSYWGFTRKAKDTQPRDLNSWLSDVTAHYRQKSPPKPAKQSLFTSLFRRTNPSSPKPPKRSLFKQFFRQNKSPNSSETSSSLSQSSSLDSPPKPPTDIEVSLLRTSAHDVSVPSALRVVHLRKTFPPRHSVAVNDSNFVMHQGELLAVLGANGSGKSTTCHMLCGITPATAGDALVEDDVSLLENGAVGVVGWCPQHDILFDELTSLEHVFPHRRNGG